MKKNILVFPCGSEIALDIYSSVEYSTHFNLIGASSVEDHGSFVYENYISDVPFITDDSFIPYMANVVAENKIDAIYPAMDLVITILKENESKLGCKVIAPSPETTQICLSKDKTYDILKDVINTPKVFSPTEISEKEFPVFAKPKVGYGAKGTKLLKSKEEVESFLDGKDNMLVLEYLPGEEFTVDCFTDRSGRLLYSAARKRNRIKDGISVNTYFAEDQTEFLEIANRINTVIKFRGAWFYQVKRDCKGQLCLLEVAARLGGSSLLSRAVGVNFALLTLYDAFDCDVKVFKNNYSVELDRALDNKYKTDLEFDAVFCDYDDCLVLNKTQVNYRLVSFLFKCRNNKKHIILLTKHEGTNLLEELRNFRLDQIFDEIIHIKKEDDKSKYIDMDQCAIFIDDSNSERYNISSKLGIPVFSPDMIDVLL